jgi:hypothetical protein
MKTLFQMQGRGGRLVQVNLNQENIKEKLYYWLKEMHNEIFWDIEMQEGGSVELCNRIDGDIIVFSGDNGIFEMEEVIVQTV